MQQLKNLRKKEAGFTSLSHKDKGFTIIEVMIVLVIAAVIILIVFLAVPALQRNSRNNQRKSHAARLLAAANEYRTNTNNTYPSTTAQVTDLAGTGGFYGTSNIFVFSWTLGDTSIATPSGYFVAPNVYIATGAVCKDGNTIGPGNGNAVFYYVETGGSPQGICS